eukprot:Gb_04611 [translate_table: standard]
MVLSLKPMLQLQVRKDAVKTTTGNVNNSTSEIVRTLCMQGRLKEALNVLNQCVDSSTYVCLLQGCTKKKASLEGRRIHAYLNEIGFMPDRFLRNTLVNMYAKCGSLVDAREVFNQMPERDVFSWTVMIAANTRHGFAEEALRLFNRMQREGIQPNQFTFASVLPACGNLVDLKKGMEIHEDIIRSGYQLDVFVGNTLVDMYAKCRSIDIARDVFDKMHGRDVVSWTTMIAGYAQNGHGEESLKLFQQMQLAGVKPNLKTFASVLSACADLGNLGPGMELHVDIIRRGVQTNVFVESALLDMYAKCGSIESARELFDKMPHRNAIAWTAMIAGYSQKGNVEEALNLFRKMPERNIISWTAMIAGCAQNGHGVEALELFRQMQLENLKPDSKTLASVLPACANLTALEQGMEIHERLIRSGFQCDVFVESALVDMYAKCGSIEQARHLFDKMHQRNIVSWTAIMAGYAMHGCAKEALKLFEQMQHSGMNPDHVTLVCVLSACCHAGLVDKGRQYFNRMSQSYHITPTMEHYGCMVDLLGRAGLLAEAQDFINKMPIKPDISVWGCLLGACRVHNNVELGERVADCLFELNPTNAAPYVVLSNIYAAAGRWDGIEKETHHNHKCRIFRQKLGILSSKMNAAVYVPNRRTVLNDVEEQKEQFSCHRSKKLAIIFRPINMFLRVAIWVIKNVSSVW